MDTVIAAIQTGVTDSSADLFLVFGSIMTVIVALFGIKKVYGLLVKAS